ncbi:hypothetical protein BGZ75_005003 [Mortierella antarctica]|nr:hypothetical protein BGZ75_005003 [Mortierella antarctica]
MVDTKTRPNIFSKNIAKPGVKVTVPKLGARIDKTEQLALCASLLVSAFENGSNQSKDHIRWLLARMVEEFIKDTAKGSTAVTEVVLLGPVLDREHYRKLLSCFISEFEKSAIPDVSLLHGLVQLVHRQISESTEHPYHLTLAVSRVLDVMAKHEVKDLDRVEQHEPLGGVLSSLRSSSDPFLMYQAPYAFQALQCVPDDETVLQEVMRHSKVVAESLFSIAGVFSLNLMGFWMV